MATFGKIGPTTLVNHRVFARDYIQDGLIAMWDGIENAGFGVHDANATVWKDLTGNGYDFRVSSKGGFGENYFISQLAPSTAVAAKFLPDYYTIEMVLQPMRSYEMLVLIPQNNSSVRVFAIYTMGNNSGNMKFLVSTGKGVWSTNKALGDIACCAATYSGNAPQNYYANGIITTQSGSDTWGPRAATGVTISDTRGGFAYYGKIYSIRTYSRALTAAEIAHNYAIDKARFNLPS